MEGDSKGGNKEDQTPQQPNSGPNSQFQTDSQFSRSTLGFFSIRKLVSNTKEKQQIETSTQKEAPENKEEENQEKDRHKIEAKERK